MGAPICQVSGATVGVELGSGWSVLRAGAMIPIPSPSVGSNWPNKSHPGRAAMPAAAENPLRKTRLDISKPFILSSFQAFGVV